eukprot:gene388-455_t
MNDKIVTYVLALQMAFGYPANLGSCLAGLIAGILYYTDVFGVKRRRMPRSLSAFCSRWIVPFLASPNPPSKDDIETLVSMGFPRNLAIEALQRTNNNLNDATNFLLGGH